MKRILTILFLLIGLIAFGQRPNGFPTQFSTGWYRQGYQQSDSGTIVAKRDTTFSARYSGTLVFRPQNRRVYYFDSTASLWNGLLIGGDTSSLSTRINFKFNTSDTANKWLGLGSRFADTLYRVNDSTIGYTIKGQARTFQILGRSGGGGGGGSGTVTSVGMTVPSAFNVSTGSITTSGTFNISGAGVSTQYIRGNGTLATTDTGMIPNFYLKSRGLLSGSGPISYNTTSGAIGIANANTSGTKGAASFTSRFSDNGSGLIDLADLVSASNCTNCDITFNSKGQATSFTSGSGASVNARRSVTKATLDSLQFVNDTTLNSATGKKFSYQLDTTGRRAYYEDKYVVGKTYSEIRKLRLPDTSYIYRVNIGGVVADYKYDPSDAATTDDTVMTIVSTAGYRYKRYILDATVDPVWWDPLAGTTGHNSTAAIQACLNAITKYTTVSGLPNGQGLTIRLYGYYTFNPSTFVYPNISCTFQIKGGVQLLDTWTLPGHWNIEGISNSTYYEVFGQGGFSSISTNFTNATTTPKAALELKFGTQIIRNIAILSQTGIGLHLNGALSLPASLATIENVYVNCNGYAYEQTGILVSDWFWSHFKNVSSSVEQGPSPTKPGSSVKLEGKTLNPNENYMYLCHFEHLITAGRPIRIQASPIADAGLNVPIFNIKFQECVFENIQNDSSVIILNSNNIGISNVTFDDCATADCPGGTYLIKNIGHNTIGVTVNMPFDRFLYTGDPIQALVVNNMGTRYPLLPKTWTDNISSQGHLDVKNLHRGWSPPLDLMRFQDGGGQISKSASDMRLDISGNFIAPFAGWNGDTIAAKMPPSPPNYTQINFKNYSQAYHKGDKIVFGCWVKVDTITPGTIGTQLMAYFDAAGYTFKESGTKEYIDDTYDQSQDEWQFISSVAIIDTADGTTQTLHAGIRNNGTYDTVLISNPFVILVDSSLGVTDAEVIRWAREYKGGEYGVPKNSYSLRDDARFYIGDSTRFDKGVLQRLNTSGMWVVVGAGGGSTPTGTSGSIAFYGVATTLSQKNTDFFYDSTNIRVGIGTNTPSAKLTTLSSSTSSQSHINMVDNASSGITFGFHNRYGGTAGKFALVNVGTGSSVWTTNSAGNVGINNDNPNFRLDISGSFHTTGDATLDGNVFGSGDNVVFTQLGSDLGFVKQSGFVSFIGISNGNTLSVKRSSSGDITGGGSYTEKLTLDASDNFGINNSSPTYRLDVTGSTRTTDSLMIGKTRIGTSADSVLVIDATSRAVKTVAQSSIGGGGSGITTLNTLTASTQTFATGTTGTDFNISSSTSTHTFNIPSASTSNRGLVTTSSQTFGGAKTFNDGITVTSSSSIPRLTISGDYTSSSAPGIGGIGLAGAAFTYTDNGAARTVSGSDQKVHKIGITTITSSNAVTYADNTATLYLDGAPTASGSMTLSHPWALYVNSGNSFLRGFATGLTESSSGTTLADPSIGIYSGTGGHTWTLPTLATYPGKVYYIKNAGSGNLTLSRGGSDNLYDTSSVTSITISAGAKVIVVAGTSFWYIFN